MLLVLLTAASRDGKYGPVSRDGEAMEGVEVYGVIVPSAIGPRSRENVDDDGLGV